MPEPEGVCQSRRGNGNRCLLWNRKVCSRTRMAHFVHTGCSGGRPVKMEGPVEGNESDVSHKLLMGC